MRKKIILSVVIVVTFFIGVLTTYTVINLWPNDKEDNNVEKVVNEYKIEETASFEAIDKVYDAVIVVQTYNKGRKISSGTGFVYKKENDKGYIITNYHVISGADKVEVLLTNGDVVNAEVLGSDVLGDIAVLSIPANKVIKVSSIATTDNTRIGSTVFAIGAPMGSEYSGTTTKGTISAKERVVTFGLTDDGTEDVMMKVIQTDAAINPGNSGGPLINLAGEVIGVTSLKLVQEEIEGIGFAIPIADAMKDLNNLEQGKEIDRPVLGVKLLNLNEIYALFISDITVDSNIKEGVVIEEVSEDSAAFEANLQKGDVIFQIGKVKVKNKAELRYELYKYNIGDNVKIKYYRGNIENEVEVTLKNS